MYAAITVKHDKLIFLDHELEDEKLNLWVDNERGGRIHLALSVKDLDMFEVEMLAFAETIERYYQDKNNVERG